MATTLPASLEAEEALLGAMMLSREAAAKAFEMVEAADFGALA
ncbi:MAG TPA: DnaB-like helicase N-terminal domain-containing protein [Acidimicrobiales bacterium]|nr:DnaB-like helicase N-terminal domain-containing protein [Acidimicrobiales bacterium]